MLILRGRPRGARVSNEGVPVLWGGPETPAVQLTGGLGGDLRELKNGTRTTTGDRLQGLAPRRASRAIAQSATGSGDRRPK